MTDHGRISSAEAYGLGIGVGLDYALSGLELCRLPDCFELDLSPNLASSYLNGVRAAARTVFRRGFPEGTTDDRRMSLGLWLERQRANWAVQA